MWIKIKGTEETESLCVQHLKYSIQSEEETAYTSFVRNVWDIEDEYTKQLIKYLAWGLLRRLISWLLLTSEMVYKQGICYRLVDSE